MTPAHVGTRPRILVVDDMELNRVLTAALLEGRAYEVDCVADGGAAVSAVDERPYDLVLMDLDLPGLDGFETASRIRARRRAMPLAALTSHANAATRARVREIGFQAHLRRPLAPAALANAVAAILAEVAAPRPHVFRPDLQQEIVSRLGLARTAGFLADLLDQCERLRAFVARGDEGHGDEHLDRIAHDLASTSGMLGYEELSLSCRDVLTGEMERAVAVDRLEKALWRAIDLLRGQTRDAEAA